MANYGSFKVGSEADEYKLYLEGYDTSSTLLDAFNFKNSQNGRPFSTKDRPNGAVADAYSVDQASQATIITQAPCAETFVSGESKQNLYVHRLQRNTLILPQKFDNMK